MMGGWWMVDGLKGGVEAGVDGVDGLWLMVLHGRDDKFRTGDWHYWWQRIV